MKIEEAAEQPRPSLGYAMPKIPDGVNGDASRQQREGEIEVCGKRVQPDTVVKKGNPGRDGPIEFDASNQHFSRCAKLKRRGNQACRAQQCGDPGRIYLPKVGGQPYQRGNSVDEQAKPKTVHQLAT